MTFWITGAPPARFLHQDEAGGSATRMHLDMARYSSTAPSSRYASSLRNRASDTEVVGDQKVAV
jgi:hypothetical protein